jgi:hypothetical protein
MISTEFRAAAQELSMDVNSIAGSMALSSVASQVTVGVMKDIQSLQGDLVARLFGSIGIGNGVDAYA